MFGKTRTLIVIAVTLALLCAAFFVGGLVYGGLFAVDTALDEKMVSAPTPDLPGWDRIPPADRTQALLDESRRATAQAGPIPPKFYTTPPTGTPVPAMLVTNEGRPAGAGRIGEGNGSPMPMIYMMENDWRMFQGDKLTIVFAGAEWSDGAGVLPRPWQGVVFVQVTNLDGSKHFATEEGTVKTPVKEGSVRIVDATGMRLKLEAENGTVFFFDVPTLQFVSP